MTRSLVSSAVDPAENVQPDRLHGRWLDLVRAIWLAAAALAIMIFVANMPPLFDQIRTPCTGVQCFYPQLPPGSAQAAGLSMDFYAGWTVVTQNLGSLVF